MQALKHHPDLEHYLPETFTLSDVHTYLDGGVHPNTRIRLSTGEIVCMHALNVGDILWYGETVESIIRVKTDDIYAFYDISYKGEPVVSATKNIDIVLLDSYPDALTWTKIEAPPECIHIITNKNGFQMKHVFIGDYNRGIDRYMTDEILNKAYRKL